MLQLEDVYLDLRSTAGLVHILKGISVEIQAGERVGLVGPSGSGKSSLMMLIGGLERATRGRIAVAGQELAVLDEDGLARFRRDNVGIVFQNFHLVPTMTALENVALPAEFAGAADAFERAAEGLAAVGLHHRLEHYPGQLSGGEQQRVALARALIARPRLVLADEPTGNLDGATGERVIELLFDLAQSQGSTLILITHDPALAERCDRILKLGDGRLIEDRSNRADRTVVVVR
ncbi:MAG TPA: ATP-binding cassette domain-containing protein [Alphaproteobacteria bacterium]|nr:ATP-binding cassette domain-containing protein [Alphaproteobacteria bacterium]